MAKVEQKQPIVAEISEAIKDAASIVLVTYSGITVEQDTAMRKELREAGVSYKVYKNTMRSLHSKAHLVKNFANIWKDRTQSLSAKMMQLLLQESWLNMQKM